MKRKAKTETEQVMVWENGALRFRTRPKWKNPHTFHTSATFMDYLHGDVKEEEAWAACYYECAREFDVLWKAAIERDALRQANPQFEDSTLIAIHVFEHHAGEWWATNMELVGFMACDSFPKKDWNELSEAERHKILGGPAPQKIRPLSMTNVWELKAFGVFDRFIEMGENSKPVVKDVPPGAKSEPIKFVAPLLPQHTSRPALYYALFNLDFSKTETELANEFKEWLKLPETKALLQKHKKPKTGTTGKPLDRLKDLAAWRLYRECGDDWNKANKFANDHRKRFTAQKIGEWYKTKAERKKYSNGDPMPFRDAKPKKETQAKGKTEIIPPNRTDVFGEEADARKAKASAEKFLRATMPEAFPPPPSGRWAEALKELEEIASDS